MKPTKPGEWWWVDVGDGVKSPMLVGPERLVGEGLTLLAAGMVKYGLVNDPDLKMLGPVAPFAPSPDPAAPDASDEVRLAAKWVQQAHPRDGGRPKDDGAGAPGPAGLWRLHASGVWMRWVVAS